MTDRGRFFFKCTRLFAQCRAVIPFGNRRGTDRCRIGVMRFCACTQCRRLESESTRFHTDRHRVFACQFSRTRYCIISDRQIRLARVPCIPRIRHTLTRMILRFSADIGAITDGNALILGYSGRLPDRGSVHCGLRLSFIAERYIGKSRSVTRRAQSK